MILLLAALVAVLAPFAEPAVEASGAPGSVGSVSLSRADGTVTASWGAVSGATRYHATYSTDGGGSWHAPVSGHRNITSTSITFGADNASTYIVGVRAGNDQGWGSWTNSSPAGPFVPPKRTPTPTPTPEPTPTPTPTPKPPTKPPTAPSVTAARGTDATTATVSWTKYTGDDFDYYRFVVCPEANFIGGTCSNNVFTSDAYYSADSTGPVKVTGLDASTGYGVILQVWRRGGAGALKPNTTIPAAAPAPTPTQTPQTGRSLTFGSHTVGDQSWTKDTAIDTLTLPAATLSTDGLVGIAIVPAMTYTLTPDLPAGASFDASARTISGTPTAEAASATYTYTASADGYNSASLTFTIAVNAPQSTAGAANAALSFGDSTIADQSWHKDDAITTLTLPQATGGGGTITYGLSSLPTGLSFDASARTITGTPTATSAQATYRYTATDGTDTVMLSFKIEVLEKAAIGCSSLKSSISVSASTNPSHTLYALALSINSANGSADQAKIEWKKKSDSTWSEKAVDANISSAAIESLDSSTTYEVMFAIRFNSSHLDFGQCGWKYSDVAEATTASPAVPNKPAAPTVTQNATTPKTQLDVTWTATYGAPKVSGYFVEYKKKSETNWIQWGNEYSSSNTLETTITGLTEGTTYEARVQAKNSQGTGSWSDPGEGTTQDKNVDPEFSADTATRDIAENSAADANVGAAVTTTDTENDTLTYSLSGTDASSFTIDSATGQIKVGSGTTLDFESSTTSYSVTVGVSDLKDSSDTADTVVDDTITITINVTDVNEPPPKMDPSAKQQASSPKYQIAVNWQAPTITDRPAITHFDLRYKKKSDSTWTQKDDLGKTLKYYAITGLTYKTDYQVEMRAANDEGDGPWSDTDEVKTHDQTEPEFENDTYTLSIAENAGVGDDVGKVAADDDDNDALYYSMSGTGASDFSLGQYNGTIDVAKGLDYETTKSYTLTLSVKDKKASDDTADDVVDDTTTVTINVTDVNEPPVKLSAPTVSANSTTPTTKIDVSWTALTNTQMSGKPAVDDYDVQYRLAGDTDWTDASFTGTTTSTTLTGLTNGKTYEVQVRAGNHEGDGPWSDTRTAITDANAVTRSIAENSAADSNVGAAVTAVSTNTTYTYTHALSGTDASKFEIGSTTGQITVKSGTSLDYETKTSYSVTVTVTAAAKTQGANTQSVDPNAPGDYVVPVTINVTDVNEPPPKMGTPTVAANSTTPTSKIDVSWTAPTMTGKPAISDYDVQYRQTGTSTWSSHSFTGTGTSTTLTGLTNGKTYEVQVRAVNAEGNGAWSDSGTAITQAASVTRSVAENSASGTNVGAAVTAVSTNTSYTYTHALSGTDASKFEIGSSTGQITVKSGTSLDYETKTSYSVTVTVTAAAKSGGGANAQSVDPNAPGDYVVPVTINVTDVNEPPAFADDTATRSIAENSAAGTSIGAVVTATDPDTSNTNFNTLAYSLTGTDASKFNIGSSTGQITVKTGNIPDYEAKTSYSVTVNVTDGKNASGTADTTADDTIAVTINVTDVNEPPAAPAAPTVAQNSTTPTTKLDVSWTAPTNTGKPAISDYDVQYRKSGDSTWTDASFTGTTTSTTLTGLTAGKSYEVQVRAVNDEGDGAWSASGSAITKAGDVTRSINENSAAGTNVGAAVTASNTTYTYTHALSGTDASSFSIASDTGQITVGTGTTLDYESGTTSYSVVVTVTAAAKSQGAGAQSVDPNAPGDYVIPVTIKVTDVDEPPGKLAAPTVTQNVATPKTKLDVSWTALTTTQMSGKPAVNDYDVQYKKSSDTDWTEWNANDDSTTTSTTLTDLEEGTEYEVQVRAGNDEGDGGWSTTGKANTQDKNVHAEFPDQTATRSIAENTAAGGNVGAAVTANDTESHTLYYSLNGTDKDSFNVGLNTGQITVKSGSIPNYEAKTSYSLTVEVSDRKDTNDNADTKIDDTIDVTINVTDVAEPPAAPAVTVAANSTTPATKIDVSWTAPVMTGKPAISGYDVQYKLSGANSWTGASFSGTGTSTTLSGLTQGKSYEVQVRAVNAEGNGAWASSSAITDANAVTRSIAENSAAGTKVGAAVTAKSTNTSYTYSHALSGTDASKFEIGSSTGQITVGTGTDLDYETKTSYSVIVTVTAAAKSQGAGAQSVDPNAPGDYVVPVTINVTDVNETAKFKNIGLLGVTREIAENSAASANVGAPVSATDPDSGDTLTYSLTGTDADKFDINSSTGQITVGSGTSLDFEAKTNYLVTVQASDGKDENGDPDTAIDASALVNVNVTDVSEPPAAPDGPTVAQSSTTPKTKLDVSWAAPDMTGKPAITDYDVQYKQSSDSTWTSHSHTGTGTSATLTGLEGGRRYDVQIRATNDEGNSGWSTSGSAKTQDKNVNSELSLSDLTRSIAENSGAGRSVGAPVTATDTEDNTLTYSISGASEFTIDSATGQIKVASGADLDYEDTSSYKVTVGVSDGLDSENKPDNAIDHTADVIISITDVDEAPAPPNAPSVTPTASAPRTSLDVSWTAPNTSDRPSITDYDVQYKKTSATGWSSYHPHVGSRTSITLTGLESGAEYEVQVRATNDEGSSTWSPSGTGSTEALSSAPKFSGGTATRAIAENSAAGANVGAPITATDSDDDTLTYGLGGTDAGSFAIDSATGQITVGATTKLDYEDTTSYSVTVEVSDGKDDKGNADTAIDDTIAVTIDVTDVNEPPDAPGAPTVTRSTGSPKSMLDAGWTAPDMTGKPALTGYDVQYRASGDASWTAHAFTGTGTSTTLAGLSEGTTYEVQVRATNDEGTSAWSASGSASTKGRNTDPSFGGAKATRSVAENSAAGTKVGKPVTASDPDGDALTYSLNGTDAASFTIDASTGQIEVGAGTALDYESTTSYGVTVGVSDGLDSDGNADSSTDATIAVTINITDVNEPPGAPGKPKVVQGSDAATMLDASWTAPDTTGIPPITDYDVQYRATGGAQWDDHSFDGTGTSTTVTSLTAGVYYEVRVRASNDEGTGPWSRPGSADTKAQSVTPIIINIAPPQPVPPGRPDAPDVSPWRDDPQTALYVTWQVPANNGPAITGYRLRYRMPGDLTWGSLKSTTTNATITDLTAATTYEVQVEAYNSDRPGPWSPSGMGTTEDYPAPEPVNGAPALGSRSGITFTVAENSTAGTAVGDPIEATDPDDDAITYTLDGAVEFTIDADTGQIRVARDAALDYEAVRSYTVTVGIGDGLDSDGNADPAADDSTKVTIVVTDVDEPPAKADAPAVTQNADSPTDALIVKWDAPYNPGPAITGYDLRYRVKGATAWTAHPVEGTVTIARLDGLKSATVYEARVRARNDEGAGPWSDSGAGATATANRASAFPSPGSGIARSVAENSPAGTLVGEPVTATDPNGDVLTYGMSGAGEFTIEAATGQIVVAEGAVLDYEAVRSYTVTVTVTDGVNFEGNPDTATDDSVLVTIYVIDVDESAPVSDTKIDDPKDLSAPAAAKKVEEPKPWVSRAETPKPNSAPVLAAGAMFDVAENSAAGTLVGGPVDASDADGDPLRFTLDGAIEFTIDSYTGQIAVARGADLDYETVQSYTLTVTVSDGLDALGNEDPSADDSAQVTIFVTDADEPPARPDAPSVAQHPDTPTSGLVVEWAAPANTGPAITGYDLRFRVEGETAWITHPVTGSVTVASIANLQNASTYETQVRAVNDEGIGPWSDAGTGATAEPNTAPAIVAAPAPAPSAGESKPENPVTELVVARDSGPSEPAKSPTAAPSEATPEAAARIISANLSSITWLLALAAALLAILIFAWKRRRKKRQAPAVQSA